MDERKRERARRLRSRQTDAERWLWRQLRGHRCMELKFKRQVPMGAYIVDFVCHARGLIIELDGGQHADCAEYDDSRTRRLNAQGYQVLRFWNDDVLQQGEAVLESIRLWLEQELPFPPAPLPPAGEGLGRGALALNDARGWRGTSHPASVLPSAPG
ncbi:endonuclease domain-containing protein [Pseudomonas sp. N040]|uniref:endonuclease domain-containing protein n=1 Tax=Pseudomonas sp. N040 TaxID=2785325 RepID=UPI0018A2DDE1|nr:endonuclease domain-containing protein [Pseudomonas sp. N040]MBF7730275.1 endonuclease domain-containing protein [Pseudomonas sp. N040]MBW7013917.1 endonuclease domain-containing protein [Pseudomonas sp. N040]